MKNNHNHKNNFPGRLQEQLFSLTKELAELKNLNFEQRKNLEQCVYQMVQHTRENNLSNNVVGELDSLILASYFIERGYDVLAEKKLTSGSKPLVADIFARLNGITEITEVESGNVPSFYVSSPNYNIPPELYHPSRLISKVARYSIFADLFNFGFTAAPSISLDLVKPYLDYFRIPTAKRKPEDTKRLVEVANLLYSKPKINEEQVKRGRLDKIYVVNCMEKSVRQIYP